MATLVPAIPWASAEVFQRIFDSINDGVLLHDRDGRVLDLNQATLRILGTSREAVFQGDLETSYSAPGAPQGLLRGMWEKAAAGEPQRFQWKGRRQDDGRTFHAEVSLCAVPVHGRAVLLSVFRDVSERDHLEEQLHQAQKMDAIGRLAGGIAHDFSNLLTVITGYAEMLLAQEGPECSIRGELEEIRGAAERAGALTQQLLIFSRKHAAAPELIDLNAIVRRLNGMLGRLMGEDVDLRTNLDATLGAVRADPVQMEQLILNLAVNARDAMPRGGKLTIETSSVFLDQDYVRTHVNVVAGAYVMMAVSDTGHGMDALTQARIFEPFFTTKEAGKGTGLGLSIVYGIVKQAGGDIWVYSEVGHGTTFKVYLPLAAGEAKPIRAASVEIARGTETVLVVEDNEGVRKLTVDVLQAAGYKVLQAGGKRAALKLARTHPEQIHLLLTDVILGQTSGRDLARQTVTARPGLKVLFMSGYTSHTTVANGVLDPGLAFLPKPFTPADLTRKVREVLGPAL